MGQNIGNAVIIMIIGMLTVFLILWFVVLIGNLIIRVTNKYWTETEEPKSKNNVHSSPGRKLAAIVTAVDIVTGGKGKVTQIKKI
jgi:oxaloacetate decarboxylase gamma subunit